MATSTPQTRRLTDSEFFWAFFAGGGLILIIIAFFLAAMRGDPVGLVPLMMFVGLLLLVGGTIGWAIGTRPWEHFDDQLTPLYTGHHDDGHGAPHVLHVGDAPDIEELGSAEFTTGEPFVTPEVADQIVQSAPVDLPPPPVIMDPLSAFPAAPAPEAASEAATKDDLTRIRGIGPKISQALYTAGIHSYSDLAAQTPESLTHILQAAGLRLTPNIEHWIADAKLAAAGDESALQDASSGD